MMNPLLAQILSRLPAKSGPAPVQSGAFVMPQQPQNIQSIFDLVRAPQQAQFDVTAASGTKPKNYQPTQVAMTSVPAASVFTLNPSALPQNIFTITPASGTKPKNYQPTQVSMNTPQLAGPQAMQQMLALMQMGATPFAPYGQG